MEKEKKWEDIQDLLNFSQQTNGYYGESDGLNYFEEDLIFIEQTQKEKDNTK